MFLPTMQYTNLFGESNSIERFDIGGGFTEIIANIQTLIDNFLEEGHRAKRCPFCTVRPNISITSNSNPIILVISVPQISKEDLFTNKTFR